MILRRWLVLTTLLIWAGAAGAQAPPPEQAPPPAVLPPLPAPAAPVAPPPLLAIVPRPAPGAPAPVLVPAPPPGAPILVPAPPPSAPVLVPAPNGVFVPDGPPPPEPPPWRFAQPTGWFFGVEAAATRPHLRVLDSCGCHSDQNLDWTVAPRGLLGYRFDSGASMFVEYRNLTTDADTGDDLTGFTRRVRLDANWFDLTYLSRPYNPFGGGFRWQWETGLRGAFLFADANNQWPSGADHVSDRFSGAGPHLGFRAAWWFGDTGLSVFTRLDGAILFGHTRENVAGYVADAAGWGDSQVYRHAVTDGRVELGLGYVVPTRPWLRFDAGIQAEMFDMEGLVFSDFGPFLRCIVGF